MPIGPSRPLHLTKPESIDIRQAARYFGARGEADSATLALLERCAAPLLAAATPRAVWLEADVESLAQVGILKGEDIFRHLEGCREALLLAVTLGPSADSQIRRAGVGDIAAGVASDALGSALAEQAADAAEAELRQWAAGQAGQVSHGPLLAGLWRLAHRGAAAGGGGAGYRPPSRALRDRKRPYDAPQERDRSAGAERPPGEGTSRRVRPLRAEHAVRIQKEGQDLCKRMNCLPSPTPSFWTAVWAPCCRRRA